MLGRDSCCGSVLVVNGALLYSALILMLSYQWVGGMDPKATRPRSGGWELGSIDGFNGVLLHIHLNFLEYVRNQVLLSCHLAFSIH